VVDRLIARGGEAVTVEDYCHAVEHSIEFQVVFLQHRLSPGRARRPDPVRAVRGGDARPRPPEDDPASPASSTRSASSTPARAAGCSGCWPWTWRTSAGATATTSRRGRGAPELASVEERDRRRIAALAEGDAEGFWELVREDDDLKWCGSSPLYAFLKATAPSRGALLRYEQWNIDPASVVSFAALAFGPRRSGASRGRRRMRGRLGFIGALALAVVVVGSAPGREARGGAGDRGGPADRGGAGGRPPARPAHGPARARHQLRSQALDALITQALLEKEAAARGMTPEALHKARSRTRRS